MHELQTLTRVEREAPLSTEPSHLTIPSPSNHFNSKPFLHVWLPVPNAVSGHMWQMCGGQGSMGGVFCNCSLPYFLRQGLSLQLNSSIRLDSLVSELHPRICWSQSPWCWEYKHKVLLVFYIGFEESSQVLLLVWQVLRTLSHLPSPKKTFFGWSLKYRQ